MNAKQREQIKKHGEDLQRIFPKTRGMDPIALCKKVFRLENEAHRFAEDVCNRPLSQEYKDAKVHSILGRLDALLGFRKAKIDVFLNQDARGYALKIEAEDRQRLNLQIHHDWGDYGIIAPEFDGK